MMLAHTAASLHLLQLSCVLDRCLSCDLACNVCIHSAHSASDGPRQELCDCIILVRLPPALLQDWDPLDPLKETIQEIFHKPNATAQPPATLLTYLPTNVSQSQGQNYEPFVEQAGNQANFPSATTGPFALGGVVSRYVAIGGAGCAAAQAT